MRTYLIETFFSDAEQIALEAAKQGFTAEHIRKEHPYHLHDEVIAALPYVIEKLRKLEADYKRPYAMARVRKRMKKEARNAQR